MEKTNQKIAECNHCGNKTIVDIISSYIYDEEIVMHHPNTGDEYPRFIHSYTWYFCKCPICSNIILSKSYFEPSMVFDDGEYYEDEEMLYPVHTYKGIGVPENVNNAFQVALKARFLDRAICLLSLRRTLEIICKDKGATSGTLAKKLEKLYDQGILPQTLNQISNIVKNMGNEAAHGDNVQYEEREVRDVIEFVEHIINYIYVLPYKLKKLQQRLGL